MKSYKIGTTFDYQTKFFPNRTRVNLEDDKRSVGFGWERVWADVTSAGTFVVYRKTIWDTISDEVIK